MLKILPPPESDARAVVHVVGTTHLVSLGSITMLPLTLVSTCGDIVSQVQTSHMCPTVAACAGG
jgi:hypothetical protein